MPSAGVKRVTVRVVLVTAAVLAAGWLLALVLGIGIPFAALRTPLEATLSRTLGQAVSITGPIAVRPTLGPTVIVQDLRIAAPSKVPDQDRLRAGRVEVRLGLLSLLGDRPRITRLHARDVSVYLEHGDSRAGQYPPPDWLAPLELSLHKLVLYDRAGGPDPQLRLAVERLAGHVLPGQPLQLAVSGWLGPLPYSADLTLPRPARLLRPDGAWPWRAGMNLGSMSLQLQGELVPPTAGQGLHMAFDVRGGHSVGAAEGGTAGPAITGRLSLDLGDGRPRVGGELQLTGLDLARMTAAQAARGARPPEAAVALPAWLNAIDAALVVHIADVGNTVVSVRDTRLELVLRDGQLTVPLATRLAGMPFHGNVRLVSGEAPPVFAVSLVASDIDAATLLHDLSAVAGVRGTVARVELDATLPSVGGVAGVAAGMRVSDVRFSYGNSPGDRPVSAVLDELVMSLPADGALTLTARGMLRAAAFDVRMTGGRLQTLLGDPAWPVSMTATTTTGTLLAASGEVAAPGSSGDTTFNLEVSGERLGDLAPWLGVSACAATPYTARGQLVLAKNIGRLQFFKAQLDGTRLSGELDWSRDEQVPLLHAVLHAETLDPVAVAGLMPVMSYRDSADSAGGIRLAIPVLPRPAVIANADIDLTVGQIPHRLVEITEVSFSGRLRDGEFQPSPFRARIGSHILEGQLDTSGEDTGVAFGISADDALSEGLLDRLFSSAVQWAGNAGVVPLRWLFGQGLSAPAVQECQSGGDDSAVSDKQ